MRTLVAPPFKDVGEAHDFYGLLMVFLRELKRSGDPVSLYQFLLAQALHHHRPAYREVMCESCGPPYPCRTVLAVALLTKFPAPWTPHSVAGALGAAGWLRPTIRDDHIYWDHDPSFSLTRGTDGVWSCEERERGSVSHYEVGTDTDCYEFIAKNVREFPIGFGTRVTEDEIDQIRCGIAPTNDWWLHHSGFPYIASHVVNGAELVAPLAAGDIPGGFFRLTADEAIGAVRAVTLAIPPGHPLYNAPVTPLAKCGHCYQATLFGFWKRFALTLVKPTDEPAQLPDPTTELFDDYRDAFAAMERHASTCTGRPRAT
jgi:hypothetical protein